MLRVKAPRGAKDILYGQPPYGWELSRDRSKLVKEPAEQRVIAMILRLDARGLSTRQIATELASAGLRTRRGGKFVATTVLVIIRRGRKPPPESKKGSAKPGRQ
jgi:hypothetical protein